jgi:transposase
MNATTIGIDLAKDVFEVAISERPGQVTQRRRLTRRQFAAFVETLGPATTVVMEACGSAHYWARRCQARAAQVRLLPAQHVRPYVRRNKTDQADAAALLEAHRCAAVHAVPVKTVEHQALQTLHRVRQQWQTTRTARINLLRGILREHGLVLPTGAGALARRVTAVLDDAALPLLTQTTLRWLLDELRMIDAQLVQMDRQILMLARTHPVAVRLQQIPGIGPLTATALVGSVPHIGAFRRARHFASSLGLTPRERSSGGTRRLGGISKRGDRYLRTLLTHGARSVLAWAGRHPASRLHQWGQQIAARRGLNRAASAVANKLARIVWAIWIREEDFAPRLAA